MEFNDYNSIQLYDVFTKFAKGRKSLTLLIDNERNILFSNNRRIIKENRKLDLIVNENVSIKFEDGQIFKAKINSKFYNCRVYRLTKNFLYCELFNSNDIIKLSNGMELRDGLNTEIGIINEKIKNILRICKSSLHNVKFTDRNRVNAGTIEIIHDMLSDIAVSCDILSQFLNDNTVENPIIVDLNETLKTFSILCNESLCNTNKHIEYIKNIENGELFYTTLRFENFIFIIMNAIHSALFLSETEVPINIFLRKEIIEEKQVNVIEIDFETLYNFSEEELENNTIFSSVMGLIRSEISKKYLTQCGGSLNMEYNKFCSKAKIRIIFQESVINAERDSKYIFNCPSYFVDELHMLYPLELALMEIKNENGKK